EPLDRASSTWLSRVSAAFMGNPSVRQIDRHDRCSGRSGAVFRLPQHLSASMIALPDSDRIERRSRKSWPVPANIFSRRRKVQVDDWLMLSCGPRQRPPSASEGGSLVAGRQSLPIPAESPPP